MQCILGHPDLRGLHRIMLVTHDPRLYLKAGFTPLKEPETYMEILDPDAHEPAPGAAGRPGGGRRPP